MLASLHRAWLARLLGHWHVLNQTKLSGALRPAVLVVDDRSEARLGYWNAATRTIGIAESHIWNQPWDDVLQTLAHEVAHQYVSEVLRVHDQTAHGHAFAAACQKLGIRAAATASGPGAAQSEADRILDKVQKLLALAASDNVHEAERAMTAANTLLLKYNLSMGDVPVHKDYDWKRVGPSFAAIPLVDKLVAGVLSAFFFVDCLWVGVYNARTDRDERQLELMGTATNLALAEYVHAFVHRATEQLWRKQAKTLTVRDARAKREFQAGVILGFRDKLQTERQGNAARGLVWVGDPGLTAFTQTRYPATRSLGGGGIRLTSAHEAGLAAGRDLTIHKGVQDHGHRGLRLGHDK